jgi:hypothetical protein
MSRGNIWLQHGDMCSPVECMRTSTNLVLQDLHFASIKKSMLDLTIKPSIKKGKGDTIPLVYGKFKGNAKIFIYHFLDKTKSNATN